MFFPPSRLAGILSTHPLRPPGELLRRHLASRTDSFGGPIVERDGFDRLVKFSSRPASAVDWGMHRRFVSRGAGHSARNYLVEVGHRADARGVTGSLAGIVAEPFDASLSEENLLLLHRINWPIDQVKSLAGPSRIPGMGHPTIDERGRKSVAAKVGQAVTPATPGGLSVCRVPMLRYRIPAVCLHLPPEQRVE